jgi:hypothetical protein
VPHVLRLRFWALARHPADLAPAGSFAVSTRDASWPRSTARPEAPTGWATSIRSFDRLCPTDGNQAWSPRVTMAALGGIAPPRRSVRHPSSIGRVRRLARRARYRLGKVTVTGAAAVAGQRQLGGSAGRPGAGGHLPAQHGRRHEVCQQRLCLNGVAQSGVGSHLGLRVAS